MIVPVSPLPAGARSSPPTRPSELQIERPLPLLVAVAVGVRRGGPGLHDPVPIWIWPMTIVRSGAETHFKPLDAKVKYYALREIAITPKPRQISSYSLDNFVSGLVSILRLSIKFC